MIRRQQHLQISQRPMTYKSKRQQYRSCDQCRRSRRACDAALLGINVELAPATRNAPSADLEWPQLRHDAQTQAWNDGNYLSSHAETPRACSNCAKTGKHCTFNWLKRTTPLQESGTRHANSNQQRQGFHPSPNTSSNLVGTSPENYEINFPPPSIPLSYPHTGPEIMGHTNHPAISDADMLWAWDGTSSSDDNFTAPVSGQPEYDQAIRELTSAASDINHSNLVTHMPASAALNQTLPHFQDLSSSMGVPISGYNSRLSRKHKSGAEESKGEQRPALSYNRVTSHTSVSDYLLHAPRTLSRTATSPNPRYNISCHDWEVHLNNSSARSMISDDLYRIYRDSIEHALSCWLTEWNCPYNLGARVHFRLDRSQGHPETGGGRERGNLGNFYARICRLDRSFSRWRTRPLTSSEDKAASRVLDTTILAYASQWSHLRPPSPSADIETQDYADSLHGKSAEFRGAHLRDAGDDLRSVTSDLDRSVQEALWHQARRSLQSCEDKESFRVIFAHLIFSITQRQLDIEEHAQDLRKRIARYRNRSHSTSKHFPCINLSSAPSSTSTSSEDSDLDIDTSFRAKIEELEGLDGPPVYLETAIRQLLCWRRQIGRVSRKAAPLRRLNKDQMGSFHPSHMEVDQRSFNMLFWLGVICDTSSAAINNRPLVISDEDSAITPPSYPLSGSQDGSEFSYEIDSDSNSGSYRLGSIGDVNLDLWDAHHLANKFHRSQGSIRWPCPVADAVAAIREATPLKVLLLRKVANLQALSLQVVSPQMVEGYIQQALAVYQYWNTSYGPFINDCVSGHSRLPSPLQSLYVVHAGQWYLAALLLADAIDTVDENYQSGNNHRDLRKAIPLTLGLRKDNVKATTELARATCGYDPQLGGGAQDSAYAFDRMVLLSEPWTKILIKCFCKSLELLIEWLSVYIRQDAHENGAAEIDSLRSQSDICIQALKTLGRKSDVACLAAVLFSNWLREISSRLTDVAPTCDETNITSRPGVIESQSGND